MSNYYYKAEDVRARVEGNWLSVLAYCAPDLEPALRKPGSHVRCPVHGGKNGDGFRLFKDVHRTGGGICNTCGAKHDGFELLMWLRDWSFSETLYEVGELVGAERFQKRNPNPTMPALSNPVVQPSVQRTKKAKSAQKGGRARAKGILHDFGKAPFEHNTDNEESFFVSLQTTHGRERTIWGVDLERALSEANASKGDSITLISHGRKAVTVERNVYRQGEVVDVEQIPTHRNEWEVLNHSAAVTVEEAQPEYHQVSNGATVVSTAVAGATPSREVADEAELDDESASNVVPLFNGQTPAWLEQVQERLERQEKRRKAYSEKVLERHEKLWNECLPLNSYGTVPVHTYFGNRGFVQVLDKVAHSDSVRFHPALSYYEEDDEGNVKEIAKFPALVAAVQDVDGNLLTLHRTYLSNQGKKAKVREAKKMMAVPDGVDINGSAIRLGIPTEGIMGVAEGMETALSAYRATGVPTWSTVNAELLKSFQVPDEIHTVIIWADLDRSRTGEIAANVLKRRLEKQGVFVVVMLPQCPIPARSKGIDWNDILVEQGRDGFPRPDRLRRFIANNRSQALAKVEYAEALA